MMPKLALLAPVVAIVMFMADAPAIGADTPDTPALLAKSLEQLSALQGFSCDFEQTLSFSDGSEQHYAGTLDVLRSRRFRWHYKLPYEQLYISDGDIIWHYEPDLLQAEVLEGLDAVDPVVMKLLDGRIGGRDVLLLAQEQPQEEPQITRYQVQIGEGPAMWLGIRSDARLAYIESLDVMDNRNRITLNRFSHVAPQSELFRFTPPEGVDVIGAAFGVVAAEE